MPTREMVKSIIGILSSINKDELELHIFSISCYMMKARAGPWADLGKNTITIISRKKNWVIMVTCGYRNWKLRVRSKRKHISLAYRLL